MPENETALTLADHPIDLATYVPPPDQDPIRAYLSSLTSPKSQKTMIERLTFLARLALNDKKARLTDVNWIGLSVVQARALRAALIKTCKKPSVRNVTLCALRGVLRAGGDLEPAPPGFDYERLHRLLRALKTPKGKRLAVGRDLSEDEILRLLKWGRTLENPIYSAYALGLLAVLLGAGARREEVCTLPVTALNDDVLRILGKGDEERDVPISARAASDLAKWIEIRDGLHVTSPTMFVRVEKDGSFRDAPLSKDMVYTTVRSWNAMIWADQPAKTRPKIATHDFRRTFATRRLDAGMDLLILQRLMGHKSLETTKGYDKRGVKEARAAVKLSGVY